MVDHVTATPVKVQVQPASDHKPNAEGNERRYARSPTFNVNDGRVVLRGIDILRLGRNDLNVISLGVNGLFIGTHQIPEASRLPPQTLDGIRHICRLVQKRIPNAGSPIHVISHHI
jgi:lysophospholipase L1-like esterase